MKTLVMFSIVNILSSITVCFVNYVYTIDFCFVFSINYRINEKITMN